MRFHGGEGQVRRRQAAELGRRIGKRRAPALLRQQPQPEQPAKEKAEHQKEILRQCAGHRGRRQRQPHPARPPAALHRAKQREMRRRQQQRFQHQQRVHPRQQRHALRADVEQKHRRRQPRDPEPAGQPPCRRIQHRRARQQAKEVGHKPHPRQAQAGQQAFGRVHQAVVQRRVDVDLLVVPGDAIVKRLRGVQRACKQRAVLPGVQVAVLQGVKAAGVVRQFVGIQFVHMVAGLARGVQQHQQQAGGQQQPQQRQARTFALRHGCTPFVVVTQQKPARRAGQESLEKMKNEK